MTQRSRTSPALMEAFLLSGSLRLNDAPFRSRLADWLRLNDRVNCLIVASDHPVNIRNVQCFIDEVFTGLLAPEGVNLVVAGRVCGHLKSLSGQRKVLLLGEVENLEPLYRVVDIL